METYNGKKVFEKEKWGCKRKGIEKKCANCEETYFAPISELKKGRSKYCSESCFSEDKNKYESKKQYIKTLREESECKYCGESRPPSLDFHHVNEENKVEGITRMIRKSYTLEDIKSEVKKCVVICANCHRVKHSNSYELEELDSV